MVVAGAAVVVNGNAGFGEQAKVPVESAEAAPAGIGKGVSNEESFEVEYPTQTLNLNP